MVFIDGVKYACATCIKGHRSTACQHSDRELFVIKRKGRPITQCSHCRELRKTQKVHVKCNCIERKRAESISSQSQTVAALPQRIPVDDYQVTSGDKTSVEALLNPCQCLTGAKCICCRLDSSVIQYSNQNNSHFDKEFAKSDTMNVPSVNNDSSYLSASSAPTAIYTLPPISANLNQYQHIHSYDNNTVNENFNFIPSLNNNGGGYSEHINSSIAQRDGNSFTTSIVPLESRYSYIDNDETDFKPRDQSGILGEEICRSTSADLANIIYSSFRSCSPNAANGNCCVSDNNSTTMMPVCRCGPGCVCSGCDTHAKRVNPKNSSSNCCSSYHEITQPEHKKIRDEDGVLLCGCGCQKLDTECSDCLKNLCEEYLLKP